MEKKKKLALIENLEEENGQVYLLWWQLKMYQYF